MSSLFEKAKLAERIGNRVVVIRLLIAILTLIALLFVWYFSLEIITATNEIEKENETIITERTKLVLKDQDLKEFDMGNILISVSTALSTILAIVFAFSQIVLSNISDRYSPHILEEYREDRKTYFTFSIFIVTILVSIFSFIFVEKDSNLIKFLIIQVVIVLLGSCFYCFIDYSNYIFEIINPLSFVEKLGDNIDRNIEQINEDETKKLTTVLGDIAVKSLKRNEDEVVKRILDVKLRIFENFLELRKDNPEKYFSIYEVGERKNIAFVYLLYQQLRLFKNAASLKNDDITLEISDKLSDYISTLFQGENNMDLIEQILETRNIRGRYFSQFLKEAIESHSNSKYMLLRIISYILQIIRYSKTKICEDYIENLILTHIFHVNRIVIDHDDFFLFRREVDDYSLQLIGWNPLGIKKRIESSLNFSSVPSQFFNSEEEIEFFDQDSKNLRSFVRFRLYFLKDDYQDFVRLLTDFLDKIERSCNSLNIDLQLKNNPDRYRGLSDERIEELKQEIKSKVTTFKMEKDAKIAEINKTLNDLYVSSILYQTFFGIGWYIVFCRSYKDLDAQKYLKEFWEHTRPEDSHVSTMNEPPVSFDIEFITRILLFGSGIWGISFDFVDFHGASKYIYTYYLLLLTYSRIKFRNDLRISLSNRDTQTELEEKYWFIYTFIRKGEEEGNQTGDLITYIDELIEEADNWNELMNFKEESINAKDAFINTREWIIKKAEEFREMKRQIEMKLPIDEKKEKNCKEEILKSYRKASIIQELVNQKEYDEKEERGLDFTERSFERRWPRVSFTRVDTYQNPWSEIGVSIGKEERNCFLEHILRNEEIRRTKIEPKEKEDIDLLFSRVLETIEKLKTEGLDPSLIFIPFKYSAEISKKSHESGSILNKKIRYEDGDYLIHDENTKLEIFYSSEITPFDDIIILDKGFGVWTYKVDEKTNERLFIDINEYEGDKSKVVLYARTIFNLEIANPERARILELR